MLLYLSVRLEICFDSCPIDLAWLLWSYSRQYMMRFLRIITACALLSTAFGQTVTDLGTYRWTLINPGVNNVSVPAKVPSQAHLDLYNAGVIPDPLFGLNDFHLRWVAYSNWSYSSEPLTGL